MKLAGRENISGSRRIRRIASAEGVEKPGREVSILQVKVAWDYTKDQTYTTGPYEKLTTGSRPEH